MAEYKDKYNVLISSIDFFSQNLHLDQIVEYGFSIFNEFKKPVNATIYTLTDTLDRYISRFIWGNSYEWPDIEKNSTHDDFAVRNGFLLTDKEKQLRYFDSELILNHQISMVMPLIIDDKLYGFILASDRHEISKEEIDFLNEISDFNTEPELNPNSGNEIKLWGFYKSNLDN